MPYLTWAPSAWVLPLKFTGGGLSAPGKLMVDSEGNLWAGDNFIVGAQNQDALWSGSPSSRRTKPLSPMTYGFTGGGVEGIGFGLAIDAQDNCWGTCYGSKSIVKFDKNGKPLSPPGGYTFGGKLGMMQGIHCRAQQRCMGGGHENDQVVYMPKGDPNKVQFFFQNHTKDPLKNPGHLLAPFSMAIDQQNRIWIGNGAGDWVTRFSASDPTETVEKFKVGYSVSGLAVDSQGNVWIANRLGNSLRGAEVLAQMLWDARDHGNPDPTLTMAMSKQTPGYWEGGSITVLKPDGSQAECSPINGKGLAGPWAVVVDGDDNVWVNNLVSDKYGIVELCGPIPPRGRPAKRWAMRFRPGGYVGGGMQMEVDLALDPAGNIWVGNNWQNLQSVLDRNAEPLSTLGAGQGVVVFYGLAKPVKTPLIGPVRKP